MPKIDNSTINDAANSLAKNVAKRRQVSFRIDEILYLALKKAAEENSRSLNMQIVHYVKQGISGSMRGEPWTGVFNPPANIINVSNEPS